MGGPLAAAAGEGGDKQEAPAGLRRNGKVEPSAGSAFSPPPPSFSELPPIQVLLCGLFTTLAVHATEDR